MFRSSSSLILNDQQVPRPAADAFKGPDVVRDFFAMKAVVHVKPHEQSPDWLSVMYDVQLKNVSIQPIRGFVAYGWLDEAMRRWIGNGILQFGMTGHLEPMEFIAGQKPYGLYMSRIVNIPHPRVLRAGEVEALTTALHEPLWVRMAWDKHEYLVRIPPEEIEFEGLELLSGAP